MTKEVIDIHIADVLERVQSVERLINMYQKSGDDVIAMSMIKQYNIRKAEFVERLNHLRKQALLNDTKLEQIPFSKRAYIPEPSVASVAHEPVRAYGAAKDDLKLIEGIGPKIEELLNQADICTFEDLAATPITRLRALLDAGGNRFQTHNPETWAQQATLAADGNWESLKKMHSA
jgi:predicted flap endonuclease-1-like 5' DNA nuclease